MSNMTVGGPGSTPHSCCSGSSDQVGQQDQGSPAAKMAEAFAEIFSKIIEMMLSKMLNNILNNNDENKQPSQTQNAPVASAQQGAAS